MLEECVNRCNALRSIRPAHHAMAKARVEEDLKRVPLLPHDPKCSSFGPTRQVLQGEYDTLNDH